MNLKIIMASIYAISILFFFTILPSLLINYLPKEIISAIKEVGGFDLQSEIFILAVFGIVLAIVSFTKNALPHHSILNLSANIFSDSLWFYFFLLMIGLGNPFNFGFSQQTITMMGINSTITLNFTFFVILSAIVLILKIIKDALRFYVARKEKAGN